MVRVAYARAAVIQSSKARGMRFLFVFPYCERSELTFNASDDDMVLTSPVGLLRDAFPPYVVQWKILATDALASIVGFQTLMSLTYEHLFGMQFCSR